MRTLIDRCVVASGQLGGIALIILCAIVVTDVFVRTLGGQSIVGAAETASVFLVFLAFFGMSYTQRSDGHVSMEAVQSRVAPRARDISRVLSLLICFTMTVIIVIGTAQEAYHSYKIGEYQFGTMRYPFWPMKTGIAIGFLLLGFQQAVDLHTALRKVRSGH